MIRKMTLLLILAVTLTMLFGAFPVAADELVGPAQVTTSAAPNETERVRFEGAITDITPGVEPDTETATITVEAVSVTPVMPTPWTVHINADTRIRIGGEEGAIADLALDQQVKVEGTLQDDGSVLACKIHVRQNDDAQVGFRGTIIAKSDEVAITPLPTLTVQVGSRTITVVMDENTVIKDADGQPITFDDLLVGQRIEGKGVLQENGSILASEIEVLEDNGGPGHERVRFEGRITKLPNGLIGKWTVETTNTSSMPVTFSVDENTKIRPPGVRPEVGDWAKVTAVRQEDGALLALKVHIRNGDHPPRPVEFRGIIERIEGDPPTLIVVSVLSTTDTEESLVDVLINNQTHIEGELWVGAHVKVQGFLLDNRSVLAKLIVVKSPR